MIRRATAVFPVMLLNACASDLVSPLDTLPDGVCVGASTSWEHGRRTERITSVVLDRDGREVLRTQAESGDAYLDEQTHHGLYGPEWRLRFHLQTVIETAWIYDVEGRLRSESSQESTADHTVARSWDFAYDGVHEVERVHTHAIDAAESTTNRWVTTWDGDHRVLEEQWAEDQVVRRVTWRDAERIEEVDALADGVVDETIHRVFDDAGRPVEELHLGRSGLWIRRTWDADGRPESEAGLSGELAWARTWASEGHRLLAETDRAGVPGSDVHSDTRTVWRWQCD